MYIIFFFPDPDAEALEEKITQLENQIIDLETDKEASDDKVKVFQYKINLDITLQIYK